MSTKHTPSYPRAHVFHPWTVQSQEDPVRVITGGEGVYFTDREGRRYLDFSSQVFNVNLGHGHRRVIEAIKTQAERISYVAPSFATEARIELGQRLAEITPGDLTKAFFTNSGSEANEIAFAMARMYTGRSKIFARHRSYHGTTMGALSVGGDPRRHRVEPGVPGTVRFFDPYCYRCDFKLEYPACDLHCLHNLETLLRLEGPESVAAIVVEPVTGANGCFVPPDGYLQRLRELCDRYGIVLIADEVIDGFGRTGKWFAVDHWGVTPDILVVAKGITSGYVPMGAAIVNSALADYFEDALLPLGCTYSSHPLACAAANATLAEYEEAGVIENARRMGEVLRSELEGMQARHECIGEFRGLGLLACLELVKDRQTRAPLVEWNTPSDFPRRFKQALFDRGVSGYVRWNWVFIAPPLIINETELKAGLTALEEALEEVVEAP